MLNILTGLGWLFSALYVSGGMEKRAHVALSLSAWIGYALWITWALWIRTTPDGQEHYALDIFLLGQTLLIVGISIAWQLACAFFTIVNLAVRPRARQ